MRMPGFDAALYPVEHLLGGWAEVRARRIGRIVRRVDRLRRIVGVGVAGGGGARMKILVALEPLPDQRRTDDDAILLDQASVGLIGQGDLSDSRHRQWIDKAGEDAEQDDEDERGTQMLEHGLCLRR